MLINKRLLAFWIFSLIIQQDLTCQNQLHAYFTTWYQNKPGAISVTFDDASYSQYITAYPVLEKLNIKATFSVVGEWVQDEPSCSAEKESFEIKKMGWTQLIELFNHGHELAAHGFAHEKYDKKSTVAELAEEMKTIKYLIEEKTGSAVFTMNYPYSYASGNIPPAAKEAGYLFGRTGLDTINPSSPENIYLLASQAILNENLPDSIMFKEWIDQANGNWLILMYHHLFEMNAKEMEIIRSHHVAYSYSVCPEYFEWQMETVAASGCWIAPVCNIGKYLTERDNTFLGIEQKKTKIVIKTRTQLDTKVYDHPLTVQIEIPWTKVKIKGSMDDGIKEVKDDKLFIDVQPGAKVIIMNEMR